MKRRITKLSQLAVKINAYIRLHGDADIVSIGTHSCNEEHIKYSFDLRPVGDNTYDNIQNKAIKITYEDI